MKQFETKHSQFENRLMQLSDEEIQEAINEGVNKSFPDKIEKQIFIALVW